MASYNLFNIKKMLPKSWKSIIITTTICLFALSIKSCSGHGRLIEPPSRASAWRYGFHTPPNYNDHELYCGGFARQWNKNEGKCGVCGDAWDLPTPRAHEYGGKWGQGVIVRKYNPGSDITLRVELTASHMGYFEFRICPDINASQDCLDKYLLKILGGSPIVPGPADLDTRFYPRNASRIYEIKAKLPSDLKCENCVLQWRYIAGNNWGTCEDGTGAVGCGRQEEFRACSDISIGDTGRTTMRPFRPGVKSSTPKTEDEPAETGAGEEIPETTPYIAPLIISLTLLTVLCALAAIYLYHYHGQRVKQLLRWKRNQETSAANAIAPESNTENHDSKIAPVPPPRAKRLSQVKDIAPDEPSIMIGQSSPQNLT